MKPLFMTTLLLVMGFGSSSFADAYQNTYQCVTLQGAEPRTSITIVEDYASETELIAASATVSHEDSDDSKTFDVQVSSQRHPEHPEFQILTWTASEFKVEGYLSLLDGRRNFVAFYTSPEQQNRLQLSCYF